MAASFHDDDFQFQFMLALGQAYHRLSDVGECLAAAANVRNGNPESWFKAWLATADRVSAIAGHCESYGARVSAREAWLRAATYFDTATVFLDMTDDPSRMLPTWQAHRVAFERAAALFDPPAERIAIPYDPVPMPAFLFKPSAAQARYPLIVMCNGSDGPLSSMLALGGFGALARGYAVLAFDGPGQQAMLFGHGVPFRPDWEAVITPVVDAMLARDDVDPARIVLLGVSQGGYWAPRAAAFEHRIAAVVADPGVVDVATSWLAHLPGSVRALLEAEKRDEFNRWIGWTERVSRKLRGTLAFRMRAYGLATPYDVYQALRAYTLRGVASQIVCPLLVTAPEHEQFWPGQSQELAQLAGERATLVRFAAFEGADWHCEPKALGLRDQRIFDWLDATLPPPPGVTPPAASPATPEA